MATLKPPKGYKIIQVVSGWRFMAPTGQIYSVAYKTEEACILGARVHAEHARGEDLRGKNNIPWSWVDALLILAAIIAAALYACTAGWLWTFLTGGS